MVNRITAYLHEPVISYLTEKGYEVFSATKSDFSGMTDDQVYDRPGRVLITGLFFDCPGF